MSGAPHDPSHPVPPSLAPSAAERLTRARSDFAIGLPVTVRGPDGTALLAASAETLSVERLSALTASGRAELVLTHRRAATLKIRVYDGDLARLPLSAGIDNRDLRALIDPAADMSTPLKGPFHPARGGDTRLHRAALAFARTTHVLPAAIVAPPEHHDTKGLTTIDAADIATPASQLDRVVAAGLPLAVARASRLHVFRPDAGGSEHYAVEIGRPDRGRPVLARLHSACFTGDVLGSLKCDCGPQLHAALDMMRDAGGGILCYLNQEGRGIGLANKMRAYALQDQGFDTVEANHRLGFDDDERDFGLGARMLKSLGVSSVRLLTNNPRKVARLAEGGIEVAERVPLWVGRNALNAGYLDVKADKSGHLE